MNLKNSDKPKKQGQTTFFSCRAVKPPARKNRSRSPSREDGKKNVVCPCF
jgi:hypothetical protein